MAVLSGCKARTEPKSDPGAGKYLIYYLNSSVTKLVAQEYETETKDQVALAEELVDQLTHVPRDLDCQTVLNDKVSFKACKMCIRDRLNTVIRPTPRSPSSQTNS